MIKKEELIWVDKDFAEKWKDLEKSERDIQERAFSDYIAKIREDTLQEYKTQLDTMEEDAVMYQGLYMKVKRSFQDVLEAQSKASYDMWERFDKEMPNLKEKINFVTSQIKPVIDECKKLEELLNKIDSHGLDRLLSAMRELSGLYGSNKEMFEFLVKNFQRTEAK